MSLFQIAEPGESKGQGCLQRVASSESTWAPPTRWSLWCKTGSPPVCVTSMASALLPSVVRYRKNAAPLVGKEAKLTAFEAPHDTIASVKRFMGRGPADIAKDGTAQRFGQYLFADPACLLTV